VRLFLLTWLIIIVMLTVSTLRLPSAFTAVFALVDLALLLLLLAFEQTSAAGVPSSALLKGGGYAVLAFAALGVYLFFSASQAGTGGKPLPLGTPLMR
jgi:succinate-acetate transporter protein